MAASRIFVKGLPPSLTEDYFRTHFSKRYNVTDVKLFAHRRIGYVGFKTPQEASSAVKYFNKSFIRMSKIYVELADNGLLRNQSSHPTSLNANLGSAPLPHPQPLNGTSLKRKRDQTLGENDRKLKEYLGLMEPPSKLKTWKDGSTLDTGEVNSVAEDAHRSAIDLQNGVTSETAQMHPAMTIGNQAKNDKPRKPQVEIPQRDVKAAEGTLHHVVEFALSPESQENWEKTRSGDQNEGNAASDMDWMRSRTSRLLGLVEDDEESDQSTQPDVIAPAQTEEVAVDQIHTDRQQHSVQRTAPRPESTATIDGISDPNLEAFQTSGRLFIRNLPYSASEAELRDFFSTIGPIQEVHLPVDTKSGDPKGFAFIQFVQHEHASEAFQGLDGRDFQGRLLHILPAATKRDTKLDDFAMSKLPLKKQRLIQKKAEASSSAFNWNSMYMNASFADAVLSSISDRLGVPKSELLDPSSSDAAVKQAQAETHVIQETKAYFEANGVDLGAFSSRERGDTALLVKNFSYGTKADELKKLFAEFGDVSRVLMPPSGTIAIVEFTHSVQARTAFSTLAYRKFGDSVLFLEKAPKGLLRLQGKGGEDIPAGAAPKPSTSDLMQDDIHAGVIDTSTLFVRNLSFATTNERFRECFQPLDGFVSARVKNKPDPKHPGKTLSMGFGFLEFRSSAQARNALAAMNGYNLDGHQLLIKASHKGHDAAEERKREDRAKRRKERKSKIIIKNLPFEASKKDIQNLFKAYGQLRAVRVPKKFDNSRKGFAFAEFTTPREAENAMDALRDTHLLGRRLVLDFAAGEAEDPEKEIEKMQQKIGRQSNSVALQRLTAPERRKFNIADNEEGVGD